MAQKLQKYKYDGKANSSRATRSTRPVSIDQPPLTSTASPGNIMTSGDVKAEILSSLRGDISKILRDELKTTLSVDFEALRSDIQGLRAEVANNTFAIRDEVDKMRTDVQDLKGGLSFWSDEVTSLQATVDGLRTQVTTLKDKCEDMEGRMRRSNIRIAGIAEQPDSNSPKAVAKMLKEILQLDREVKVDRSHRVVSARGQGDRERPRVIIAKLHYDEDAVEILRRARDKAPLSYHGQRVAIFPDYTASVAKARAAFTEVRKALRGRKEIRYGLLYPARLRVSHKNQSREFVDARKAMDYVKNIPLDPATESDEPDPAAVVGN